MKHLCRDVAHLLLQAEDRSLRPGERLLVRTHLFICGRCAAFEAQLKLMRRALERWRRDGTDDEAGAARPR